MRSYFLRALSFPAGLLLFGFTVFLMGGAANANVIGTDMQNFNPITSGLDFVTVQSSQTLKPGIINLGVFLNLAENTLPYYQNTPQGQLNFTNNVTGLDLNAGVGLMKDWDIGVSLPQVIMQNTQDQFGGQGFFSQTGVTEIRANTKYRILGNTTSGLATIGTVNFNQIQNNPYVGNGAGPTFDLELAADTHISRVTYGLNVGYRFRNPGSQIPGSFVQPLKNQIIASAAASYLLTSVDTKLIGEIFGSLPAQSTSSDSDRGLTSCEILGGVKHDFTENIALHAGASVGVGRGVASPDWRIYAGLNITFGPLIASATPPPPEPTTGDRYVHQVAVQVSPPVERYRTQNILFKFDSDQMIGNFDDVLSELVAHLKSGFKTLIVEGHTDSIGRATYNEKLSLRRAIAIRHYLGTKFHVDERKVKTVGYGARRPIADNGNYQGRQENRRVEFEILR